MEIVLIVLDLEHLSRQTSFGPTQRRIVGYKSDALIDQQYQFLAKLQIKQINQHASEYSSGLLV